MSADVDAYLAALPADERAALQSLQATTRAYLPDALECISYACRAFANPA